MTPPKQLLSVLAYDSIGLRHAGFLPPYFGFVMALSLRAQLLLRGESDPTQEVAFVPGRALVALAWVAVLAARRAGPRVVGHLALFAFNFASAAAMFLWAALAVPSFPR